MRLFHHVALLNPSEKEIEDFKQAGIKFTKITKGPHGEASFDIGEEDARWEKVRGIVVSLEKEFRAVDLTMTARSFEKSVQDGVKRFKERYPVSQSQELEWLEGYSGQKAEQLLALEGKYRTDSLVSAFEQAILGKLNREGKDALTEEERIVLAVEALEREVNNGGFDQFFTNSSCEFVPVIVNALRRIGCRKAANIAQRAIQATGVSELTPEAIGDAMSAEDGKRQGKLSRCDNSYYETAEPIADRLFAFIKANKSAFKF